MAEGRRWPLTLIRRGERVGSSRPDYVWWHELPADTTAEAARSVGYEVVDVVPASGHEAALKTERERGDEEASNRLYAFFNDDGYPEAQLRSRLAFENRRADNAEAALAKARTEGREELRAVLEEAEHAVKETAKVLMVLQGTLEKPYEDDPRWSPWTRFVARNERSPWSLLCKVDTSIRAALDSLTKEES